MALDLNVAVALLCVRGTVLHVLAQKSGEQYRLPIAPLGEQSPDQVAAELAHLCLGAEVPLERATFFAADAGEPSELVLAYRGIVQVDEVDEGYCTLLPLDVPKETDASITCQVLNGMDREVAIAIATEVRRSLIEVMYPIQNKRGLVYLLRSLPNIFDHKELASAYLAVRGEKPSSPLMLARMMLETYTIGSGDQAREIRGRGLIAEHDGEEAIRVEKVERNRALYRTGGPKAKRLYKILKPST